MKYLEPRHYDTTDPTTQNQIKLYKSEIFVRKIQPISYNAVWSIKSEND